MLTGLIEKGRNKCELYFPLGKKNNDEPSYFHVKTTKILDKFTFDSKNTQQYEEVTVKFEELNETHFGKYKITHVKQETVGECVLRELRLENCNEKETRTVKHYW